MTGHRIKGLLYAAVAGAIAFLIASAVLGDDLDHGQEDGAGTADIDWERFEAYRHKTLRVRCHRGSTIARALLLARPGDTLRIIGTCVESVVIRMDRLTLIGAQGATIDGSGAPSEAVVLLDGVRGVTLENLTIRNGSDQGILATHQTQGVLRNLDLHGHGTVGLSVDRSHLDVESVTMSNNGTGGMDAYTSSTIVLKGSIEANNNGGDGMAVNGKTFLELRGAAVEVANNLGSGISVINDSRLQIFSFPEAQGSSVTADSNGVGIALLGSELGVVGSQYFGSGANAITTTNNGVGFLMLAGAILSPHATGRFVAEDNFVGMVMEDGASAVIVGGLNVRGNGTGIAADGAGTLQLVSVDPNPSVVASNGFDEPSDIALSFGTRATIAGVEVGSLSCDDTVLLRGTLDVACPTQ